MKKILIWSVLLGIIISTSTSAITKNSSSERLYKSDSILTVYKSDNLIIRKLSQSTYEHTTFLNTNTFGRVSCNGMIVVGGKEAVIFDTPSGNPDSEELLNYLINIMKVRVTAVVATHFHADCLGGLDSFHGRGIKSYASNKKIEFARSVNESVPQHGFKERLILKIGRKKVYTEFFGEGHTRDNVVAWFPDDRILFGGCLIKEQGAGKGNLADANTAAWSETVRKIKLRYPEVYVVIPGHGEVGGLDLLDYTIGLFEMK